VSDASAQIAHQGSSITHRLFRGASIYVLGLAIGKGLTVVLQVVLGRWLGPDGFGLYSLGYSVVSLLSWVAVLGLDQGVLRYCAVYRTQGQPDKVRSTLWRALALSGIVSVVTAGVIVLTSRWVAARFFTPSFAVILAAFALALPFLTLIRIAGTYLQSMHDIYRMSVMQLLGRPVFNIALLFMAILLGWGLGGAVAAFVVCCVLTSGLGVYYLAKKLPPKPIGENSVSAEHTALMRYSVALMFSGISYQVILRAPQVLLGHLGNSAEVGIYSAGASFALAFGFMTLTFLQPAMPMMVELYEAKQTAGLRRLYQNATRWTLAVVMPPFLGLCLFSVEVMRIFGRGFGGAATVLLVLSLGWMVYYGKGPGSALLEMTGRQNLDLANTAGAGVMTIVLNWVMIPHWGAIGAAIATGAGAVAWALAEYVEVQVLYGIWPWSAGALVNLLGAAVASIVTVSLRTSLPWQALLLVAACVYGAFYLVAFGIERDDRQVVFSALAQVRERLRIG
jgi:O-antigen/teichoic acid export membrane protein